MCFIGSGNFGMFYGSVVLYIRHYDFDYLSLYIYIRKVLFDVKLYLIVVKIDRNRPRTRWRDKLHAFEKDWPHKDLRRNEQKESREAVALQSDGPSVKNKTRIDACTSTH